MGENGRDLPCERQHHTGDLSWKPSKCWIVWIRRQRPIPCRLSVVLAEGSLAGSFSFSSDNDIFITKSSRSADSPISVDAPLGFGRARSQQHRQRCRGSGRSSEGKCLRPYGGGNSGLPAASSARLHSMASSLESASPGLRCMDHLAGAVGPEPARVHVMRTYSGRPSSSMRLSARTAMATSVVRRPSVRECSPPPITRLKRAISASTRARQL